MPTYGYECLGCEAQFEVMQSIKDDPLTTCESCGGTLRKRVYPVGIAFKGSGFYVNDYAPKSGGGTTASATDAKPDAATGDAKPADVKADVTTTDAPKPVEAKSEAPKTETKTPAA